MDKTAALNELAQYQVTLPTEPGVTGIDTLFKLSSVITSYRDRVGSMLGEAIEMVKTAEINKRKVEAEYNLKRSQNLNMDSIKILKSADLREAAIDVILAAEKNALIAAENELLEASTFRDRVRIKYEDLKDELRTIKRQLESVNFLYALGAITPVGPAAANHNASKIHLGVGDE